MAIQLQSNSIFPGSDNNYLIGGNLINAFSVGEIGSSDDFFLVGAEPTQESNYPLLTGNILDSEGNVLFRLVRNVLTINPGQCSRLFGDHIGYEIQDSEGKLVFRVRTYFDENSNCWMTTIHGEFYDKKGAHVMSANDNGLEIRDVKHALGFQAGTFVIVAGMSKEELDFCGMVLTTRGAIHTPVRGLIQDQEIVLDGKAFIGAHLKDCDVHIHTGNFAFYGGRMEGCRLHFHGEADNIKTIVESLLKGDRSE